MYLQAEGWHFEARMAEKAIRKCLRENLSLKKRDASGKRLIPFTVSSLQMAGPRLLRDRGKEKETERARYRLRITTLWDDVDEELMPMVQIASSDGEFVGDGSSGTYRVTASIMSREADPWCGCESYEDILFKASPSRKEAKLQFSSPTLVEGPGGALPFPDPLLVFQCYLTNWTEFSNLPLDGAREALDSIEVVDFRISPEGHIVERGRKILGFVGWCCFRLKGRHPESVIKAFNVLADYSFYCGSGLMTDMGMGQTRRLR